MRHPSNDYGIPPIHEGETYCRVCQMPGVILPDDRKGGTRWQHAGRIVVCRFVFPVVIQEGP